MRKKSRRIFICGILSILVLTGCSVSESSGTKVADVDYEILEEREIPEELLSEIEEKKSNDFKLTYEADGALYIARGYGERSTGGYCIKVKECTLTSNAIIFDTELLGPRKGETTVDTSSFPYIVIKTDLCGKKVIFD